MYIHVCLGYGWLHISLLASVLYAHVFPCRYEKMPCVYIHVCTCMSIHVLEYRVSWVRVPPKADHFFLGKVTALGVLCCFALFVCLTCLLLSFFLLISHLKTCIYMSSLPPQIAFAYASAQEKAEQAASNMSTHTDLGTTGEEGEEERTPHPLPLTSPSRVVREWTHPTPLDLMYPIPHASSHKVQVLY